MDYNIELLIRQLAAENTRGGQKPVMILVSAGDLKLVVDDWKALGSPADRLSQRGLVMYSCEIVGSTLATDGNPLAVMEKWKP